MSIAQAIYLARLQSLLLGASVSFGDLMSGRKIKSGDPWVSAVF
jgi:hypothetical protein